MFVRCLFVVVLLCYEFYRLFALLFHLFSPRFPTICGKNLKIAADTPFTTPFMDSEWTGHDPGPNLGGIIVGVQTGCARKTDPWLPSSTAFLQPCPQPLTSRL